MISVDALTPEDRALWQSLAHLYAYDFSEMTGLALGDDGQFPQDDGFEAVWEDAAVDGYIFRVAGEVAGFAIVSEVHPRDYDIAQFMVLRKFRRQGVGRAAARTLFGAYKGQWVVEQVAQNTAAQAFWCKVIREFTDGHFEQSKGSVPAQRFHTS